MENREHKDFHLRKCMLFSYLAHFSIYMQI